MTTIQACATSYSPRPRVTTATAGTDPVIRREKKETASGQLFLVALVACVFFLEFFDTAGCIDELLLAGKIGVASRTNFHPHLALNGSEFKFTAAGADRLNIMIGGMGIWFHDSSSSWINNIDTNNQNLKIYLFSSFLQRKKEI